MTSLHPSSRVWTVIGLCLVVAGGASAQISSINSAVLTPRFFNDMPGAVGSYNNSYPGSITMSESGAWRTNTGGLDRDLWNFSNNGTTAYTLGANDFFSVSMTLNVSGTTAVDNEAGFIVQNANGTLPGGDLQFLADPNSHFLGMFGGSGFWNSGLSYTGGNVTLGMMYFFDSANSEDAFQFWVNYGSGNIYSPIQDWSGNLAGDTFGGYYQIGNSGSAPGESGTGTFQNIQFSTVPEPSVLALVGLGIAPLILRLRRRA